jgi:hypothetical protein
MPAISYRGLVLGASPVTTANLSFTRTSALAVPVGSTVFVGMRGQGGCYITSITDSVGNTYNLVGQTTVGNTANLFYATVTTAITTSTVLTINTNIASTSSSATALAFDNVDRINPVGSVNTGRSTTNSNSYSVTSADALRHGSMLLCLVTYNNGNMPAVTSGTLTQVFSVGTVVWQNFGYRQNADLAGYALTYTDTTSANLRGWGHVLVEVNRAPSDFFAVM